MIKNGIDGSDDDEEEKKADSDSGGSHKKKKKRKRDCTFTEASVMKIVKERFGSEPPRFGKLTKAYIASHLEAWVELFFEKNVSAYVDGDGKTLSKNKTLTAQKLATLCRRSDFNYLLRNGGDFLGSDRKALVENLVGIPKFEAPWSKRENSDYALLRKRAQAQSFKDTLEMAAVTKKKSKKN